MSYKLWREGERLTAGSPGKPGLYARMGAAEFWLFDPLGADIPRRVAGYRLEGGVYEPLPRRADGSCRRGALGVDLRVEGDELKLRDVEPGRDLMNMTEALDFGDRERQDHEATKARLAEAEAVRRDNETEIVRLRAELERLRSAGRSGCVMHSLPELPLTESSSAWGSLAEAT